MNQCFQLHSDEYPSIFLSIDRYMYILYMHTHIYINYIHTHVYININNFQGNRWEYKYMYIKI